MLCTNLCRHIIGIKKESHMGGMKVMEFEICFFNFVHDSLTLAGFFSRDWKVLA